MQKRATTVTKPWWILTASSPRGIRDLNGQCDFRVRIAAETLKRYPWTTTNNAIAAYPDYVFSGHWQITSNGVILPQTPSDWDNGDIGQRSTSVLMGLVDYYRYSGDPAAIAHLTYMGDFLLDYCQTPPDHPWPSFLISVPVKGKAYWKCSTNGMIQLDISANMGQGLLRAYQLTGNRRWFDAAKHWGDLLAARCNLDPNADPWPRYANPETAPWKDNKQTGGVTMILAFLDELIRLGYTGEGGQLLKAREAGLRYVRDRLLPAWTVDDTWARYFWDWPNPTQNCSTTADAAGYLISHPRDFPNWRNDARNILTLFLNHSSAAPESGGDVFNGAWAYPESSSCCGRSLWYAPLLVGGTMAQYGVEANDAWMRELAYRQMILQTYDVHETGVTEDNIDGGIIVNGSWLNIAHPLPLRWVLTAISWLPEELGASRENHIVRSSAVVDSVRYGAGRIEYSTFDAPPETMEVLRLSFAPREITADGHALRPRHDLKANGYTVRKLANGDTIVQVRHDGARRVTVAGKDPQHVVDDNAMSCDSAWASQADAAASRGTLRVAETKDATMTAAFEGNQVRLIGRADAFGGEADVFVDDVKQLVPIDCWNPSPRSQQVLYYKNGLSAGPHTLKVVARGAKNPYSQSTRIYVDAVQFSAESAAVQFSDRHRSHRPAADDFWLPEPTGLSRCPRAPVASGHRGGYAPGCRKGYGGGLLVDQCCRRTDHRHARPRALSLRLPRQGFLGKPHGGAGRVFRAAEVRGDARPRHTEELLQHQPQWQEVVRGLDVLPPRAASTRQSISFSIKSSGERGRASASPASRCRGDQQ